MLMRPMPSNLWRSISLYSLICFQSFLSFISFFYLLFKFNKYLFVQRLGRVDLQYAWLVVFFEEFLKVCVFRINVQKPEFGCQRFCVEILLRDEELVGF